MLSAAKKTLTCRLRARLLLRSILLGFVVQICPRIFHRRLVHRHRLKAHLWEFLPTSLARDRHQRRCNLGCVVWRFCVLLSVNFSITPLIAEVNPPHAFVFHASELMGTRRKT